MPCPWKGEQQLDCENTATPIVDLAMLKEFEGEGVDFQAKLFKATTSDAGVCAGMTMKWCEAVYRGENDLRHPGASQLGLVMKSGGARYSPGDSVRKLHGAYNVEYARRLFAPTGAPSAHKKKLGAQKATIGSLKLRATRRYKGPPDAAFLQTVRTLLEKGYMVLLSIKLEIQNQNSALAIASGWHAIGMSPKRGAKAIFDPNWGLFGYADDAALLDALKQGMLNYFTRGGNAALKVASVKVSAIGREMDFPQWKANDADDLDALLAAFRSS